MEGERTSRPDVEGEPEHSLEGEIRPEIAQDKSYLNEVGLGFRLRLRGVNLGKEWRDMSNVREGPEEGP